MIKDKSLITVFRSLILKLELLFYSLRESQVMVALKVLNVLSELEVVAFCTLLKYIIAPSAKELPHCQV